jgi:hypothetical protein
MCSPFIGGGGGGGGGGRGKDRKAHYLP